MKKKREEESERVRVREVTFPFEHMNLWSHSQNLSLLFL